MDPKQNRVCSLRKICLCVFSKLEYLSYIGVMLPKLCKSLFVLLLHHVLGVIKLGVLNKSCSVPNPVVPIEHLDLHPFTLFLFYLAQL
jgi:hypothetical protein